MVFLICVTLTINTHSIVRTRRPTDCSIHRPYTPPPEATDGMRALLRSYTQPL